MLGDLRIWTLPPAGGRPRPCKRLPLRPPGSRYGCPDGQHLTGPGSERLVHLLDAAPLGRQDEQRPPVRTAEHARERTPVQLDRLQHLAALSDTNAGVPGEHLRPHRALGVEAVAVRPDAFGPYPPVRQVAVG